ncbi:UNVERIFIED_CONTAM: hypothetical protein GTU68_060341 [Idotea baltica]|nr:hypothetical protein [Idotea baltica]
MANRHGLIAGATGTGKTVTLQVLAEGFSKLGVPVFTADVKGDLSGIISAGAESEVVASRINSIGIEGYTSRGYPVYFWDLLGKKGTPIRTTISEMGPVLLSRLLDLNDTQQGVLEVAFKFADDEGLLLLDAKDLVELLKWISQHLKEIKVDYGMISSASLGAIQRRIIALEKSDALEFFGEPAVELSHFMQTDFSGNGIINILDATKLIQDHRVYSTFLLWLLSELFEELDEVGDLEVPRLVFFFDEAHLLFKNSPKALIEKIETVVKLIRSKGVGVYFVTQDPLDVPEGVLAQLGNRVQHALRAYTPSARKNIKAAADAFRPNEGFDVEEVLTELKVGEALVSTLDAKGAPNIVERTLICPPESKIGPAENTKREEVVKKNPYYSIYSNEVDRESAYELLVARKEKELAEAPEKKSGRKRQSATEAFMTSMLRSAARTIGNRIVRGVLGSILKK